jgi:hypothetical protein
MRQKPEAEKRSWECARGRHSHCPFHSTAAVGQKEAPLCMCACHRSYSYKDGGGA